MLGNVITRPLLPRLTEALHHLVKENRISEKMSLGTFDPNRAQNLPEIEKQMAVKCVEHAQTYWNLLEKIQPSVLRLTK